MDLKDYLFAKKEIDSFSVRFVAALKIVSKKYFNGNEILIEQIPQ